MKQLTPQQVAQNWSRAMSQSGEKLKAGINAVTESPTAKAAQSIDRMVAGFQRAAAEGKIQRGLNRVTLQDWKNAMLEKGVGRVAAGAVAAQSKVASFFAEFLPFLQQGVQQLQSMPRGDLEQNIARANFMMRHNAQFKRQS